MGKNGIFGKFGKSSPTALILAASGADEKLGNLDENQDLEENETDGLLTSWTAARLLVESRRLKLKPLLIFTSFPCD